MDGSLLHQELCFALSYLNASITSYSLLWPLTYMQTRSKRNLGLKRYTHTQPPSSTALHSSKSVAAFRCGSKVLEHRLPKLVRVGAHLPTYHLPVLHKEKRLFVDYLVGGVWDLWVGVGQEELVESSKPMYSTKSDLCSPASA